MAKSEKVEFTGSQGDKLAARLELPAAGKPRAYALFAHCFTCTKDIFAAARIAAALAEEGIAVLRFDFTGLGHSEGEFANTNFSSNIGDLLQAADFLRRTRAAPDLLIGHSLGGAAVLAAAKHPKTFISLDDADHLLSRRSDAIYVAEVLSAWVGRYLDGATEAESTSAT